MNKFKNLILLIWVLFVCCSSNNTKKIKKIEYSNYSEIPKNECLHPLESPIVIDNFVDLGFVKQLDKNYYVSYYYYGYMRGTLLFIYTDNDTILYYPMCLEYNPPKKTRVQFVEEYLNKSKYFDIHSSFDKLKKANLKFLLKQILFFDDNKLHFTEKFCEKMYFWNCENIIDNEVVNDSIDKFHWILTDTIKKMTFDIKLYFNNYNYYSLNLDTIQL
ncbi:MAG: hypothetical protein MJ211_15225 [Bacteroidales bacterium]|nr:hypothetical protein [Bacteroidales bacterium]